MPSTEAKTGNRNTALSAGALPRCERKPPLPENSFSFHRFRKIIHVVCVCIFFALPFGNLMRFDIPRQRFYFFGYELWISEFSVIFFSMMFLMFIVAAMAMLYGRVYCGYLCPQMIFSEASIALESKLTRTINKYVRWSAHKRKLLSHTLFYSMRRLVRSSLHSFSSPILSNLVTCCIGLSNWTSGPPAELQAQPQLW
jgi:4Fe-4S binding domain